MTTTAKTMLQKKPAAPSVTPAPRVTPQFRAETPQTVESPAAAGPALEESAPVSAAPAGHDFASLQLFPERMEEQVQRQEEEEEKEEE